jgi:hypothetical protein
MNDLRKKRLLYIANSPGGNHKKYYSQYCELAGEGLTKWIIGHAYLTDKGELALHNITLKQKLEKAIAAIEVLLFDDTWGVHHEQYRKTMATLKTLKE